MVSTKHAVPITALLGPKDAESAGYMHAYCDITAEDSNASPEARHFLALQV